MFKKGRRHLRLPLSRHVDEMSEKHRKRPETSWAAVFYRESFCRLNEASFGVL